MRRIMLALVLAGSLISSSLAIASNLNPADSNFLFGKDQVAQVVATPISDQEMQATQGQALGLGNLLHNVLGLLTGLLGGLGL